jgi:energy-coupling factor transporter ATP-binding protein EcfA2
MFKLDIRSVRMRKRIFMIKLMLVLVVVMLLLQATSLIAKYVLNVTFPKYIDITQATLNKWTIWVAVILLGLIIMKVILLLIDGGIIKHRSISKAYKYYRLKNKIDYSLVSSKIYLGGKSTDDESIKVAKTPKVWVIDDETIHIQNLTGISDKLSTFKSELTAMLKDSYIVNTYQLDKSANYYIVELVEMSEKNRYLFEDNTSYLNAIKSTKPYELPMMKNLNINIAKAPHMLIAGATGQGKSYLLYHILFNFILKDCDMYLIDRKKVLTKFRNIVGSENVGDDHPELEDSNIFKVIKKVESIMDERERYLSENEHTHEDLDITFVDMGWLPVFLVIDELGSLAAELSTKKSKEFFEILQSIVQRGRATGVNVIVSMQQPNAKNLPTAIRDNLMFKTILGDTDDTTRGLVFPVSDLPDIKFKPGEGYFTLAGKHNKPSILFVPTFKIPLTIENLRKLQAENKQ